MLSKVIKKNSIFYTAVREMGQNTKLSYMEHNQQKANLVMLHKENTGYLTCITDCAQRPWG